MEGKTVGEEVEVATEAVVEDSVLTAVEEEMVGVEEEAKA